MQNQNNIIVEKIELQTNTGFRYKFDIPNNYIIYFEKEQKIELNLFIRKNYEELKTKFAAIDLNFIYLPFLTESSKNIEQIIAYYFPQLNYYNIPAKVSEAYNEKVLKNFVNKGIEDLTQIFIDDSFVPSEIDCNELLNQVDYKGSFKTGLLFFTKHRGAIGVSDFFYSSHNQNYELFFEDVLSYLKPEDIDFGEIDCMIDNFLPFSEMTNQLDEDAKEVVKDLENRLSELKDNGQLLFLLPILKDLLNKQSQKIDLYSISKMEIDYQNKIQLPYFKKEVELSHLTKSIYFLFLKHPEGINLKELGNYKKELLTIYTSVSNQLDYDKMAKSIDDVINLETKSIYTHLSRIKSAFYKIMDGYFAKYYIVSGSGEEERMVLFDTRGIIWNNYERFTPDML
jgi:hypothetical protein